MASSSVKNTLISGEAKNTIVNLQSNIVGLNVKQTRELHNEILNNSSKLTRNSVLSNNVLFGDYALLWIRANSNTKYKLQLPEK